MRMGALKGLMKQQYDRVETNTRTETIATDFINNKHTTKLSDATPLITQPYTGSIYTE